MPDKPLRCREGLCRWFNLILNDHSEAAGLEPDCTHPHMPLDATLTFSTATDAIDCPYFEEVTTHAATPATERRAD